jgi:DNA-binding transcriptional LysR family regulator
MLDYAALAALAAVIREGGFERAAAALGVTPSAVSQRVRGLEERVGAALVVRGQPPAATVVGARLCAHVERVRLLEADLAADLPGSVRAATPARRRSGRRSTPTAWPRGSRPLRRRSTPPPGRRSTSRSTTRRAPPSACAPARRWRR